MVKKKVKKGLNMFQIPNDIILIISSFLDHISLYRLILSSKSFVWISKQSYLLTEHMKKIKNEKISNPHDISSSNEYLYEATLMGWILDNYPNHIFNHYPYEKETFPRHGLYGYYPMSDRTDVQEDLNEEGLIKTVEEVGLYQREVSKVFHRSTFTMMKPFHRSDVFQCYTRLFSYHLFNIGPSISLFDKMFLFEKRELNNYETKLFDTPKKCSPKSICSQKEFEANLNKFFKFKKWKDLIDWKLFYLVGGSVLKCVLKEPFKSRNQDVDFFFVGSDYQEYEDFINEFEDSADDFEAKEIKEMGEYEFYDEKFGIKTNRDSHRLKLENQYVRSFHLKIDDFSIKFQFIFYHDKMKPNRIMNIFDLDCCQVGYNGEKVLCTFPFVQSINTGTMINYKLINSEDDVKNFLPRTKKYLERGFELIYPHNFDKNLLKYIEEGFEDKLKMKGPNHGFYSGFLFNNDSLQVCNQFLNLLK